MQKTLKSYFFWTHQRGSFHYDVMVTLILLFIFVTPHLWNYGDKPAPNAALVGPISVTGDGDHGLILLVPFKDVPVDRAASEKAVRKALHQAIQPVTGDAAFVVKWATIWDASGQPVAWQVWAHK